MSDEQPQQPAPAGGAPADGAPTPGTPAVQVTAQYVKDLSFENPNAAQILSRGGGAPKVSVNVDVKTNLLREGVWEVVLTIKGDAKSGDEQAFVVELSYGGIAQLTGVAPERAAPLLLVEVPRLLFPFARAVISEATRDGGFPPLLIQPIDFVGMYNRQVQALRARQQSTSGEAVAAPSTPVN